MYGTGGNRTPRKSIPQLSIHKDARIDGVFVVAKGALGGGTTVGYFPSRVYPHMPVDAETCARLFVEALERLCMPLTTDDVVGVPV